MIFRDNFNHDFNTTKLSSTQLGTTQPQLVYEIVIKTNIARLDLAKLQWKLNLVGFLLRYNERDGTMEVIHRLYCLICSVQIFIRKEKVRMIP